MSTPIKPDPIMRPTLQKKSRAITGWILLAFAVLAGLGAAYLAVHILNAKESALKQRLLSEMSSKKEITVAAVVPIENLPANTILTLSMVARRRIPVDTAPAGIILESDFNKIENKRLLFPAEGGKPLTRSMFSNVGSPADILDAHHIALTISVNSENSINKMLRPGDHIDMLWITPADVRANAAASTITNLQTAPAAPDGSLARFLGQNLKVLATGREMSPNNPGGAEGYGTITLEVTPQQAQKILVAQKSGEIRLDLRGNNNTGAWPKYAISLHDIIGYPHTMPAGVEYIVGGASNSGSTTIRDVQTAGNAAQHAAPESGDMTLRNKAQNGEFTALPFPYVPSLPTP